MRGRTPFSTRHMMTGRLCEAPEPAMYTNGSPVSRRFVGGGESGVISCGIDWPTTRTTPTQANRARASWPHAWRAIAMRAWCHRDSQLPRGVRRCGMLTTLDAQPLPIAARLSKNGCQLVLRARRSAGVTQASPAVAHGAPPKSAIGASAGAAPNAMRDQTPRHPSSPQMCRATCRT